MAVGVFDQALAREGFFAALQFGEVVGANVVETFFQFILNPFDVGRFAAQF